MIIDPVDNTAQQFSPDMIAQAEDIIKLILLQSTFKRFRKTKNLIQIIYTMPAKKTKSSKKSSPWISHVKAYAKANNCSYGDAMSRAKSSYHGSGGGFLSNAHDWVKKHKVISRGADFLVSTRIAGKHSGVVGRVGAYANKHGYGK